MVGDVPVCILSLGMRIPVIKGASRSGDGVLVVGMGMNMALSRWRCLCLLESWDSGALFNAC
jgi:hypothetical protein